MNKSYNNKKIVFIVLILGVLYQIFYFNNYFGFFEVKSGAILDIKNQWSSPVEIKEFDKHLIIKAKNQKDYEKPLEDNLKKIFEYGKVKYDLKRMDELTSLDFEKYLSVNIITSDYTGLSDGPKRLLNEANSMGTPLNILVPSPESPFNKVAGVEEMIYDEKEREGLKFKEEIFPNMIGEMISGGDLINASLKAKLKDVDVLATTKDNYPLVFTKKNKKGKILYVNGTFLEDKLNRGVLIQLIGLNSKYFFQNIINTKVMQLDDYPAPILKGEFKAIMDEYKVVNDDFYKKIWQEDMIKIMREEKIKYTGYIIGTYDQYEEVDLFMPLKNKIINEDLNYLGRKLFENGGELGLHGWNHSPLSLEGGFDYSKYAYYRPWASHEDMVKVNRAVEIIAKELYGDIDFLSYVPPSNLLTVEGKRALAESLPKLKVLCGLYTGEEEEGVYITEFGVDKDISSFYNFPRLSSGFHYEKKEMYAIYNGIASLGVFNHFVHPDDVFDPKRSKNKKWSTMKEEFQKIFSTVNEAFGFLRPHTTSEGVNSMLKFLPLYVTTNINEKEDEVDVNIQNFKDEAFFYFRVKDKKISKVSGGTFREIKYGENEVMYLIEAKKQSLKIKLS